MNPITHISLTDAVIKSIKEYLFSGEVKPGDKLLTEKELSERLGVGRSTIREALRTLQALGYVEMRPGKGAFAAITSPQEDPRRTAIEWLAGHESRLSEFLEMRRCLEPYAVRLVVERITPKELNKLQTILSNFEKAYEESDAASMTLYEEAFHSAIIRASQNHFFIEVHKQIVKLFTEYAAKSFSIRETAVQSLEPHRRIYEAIAVGDADLAAKEMTDHIELTISNMTQAIERMK